MSSPCFDWSSELVLAEAMAKCGHINDLAVINGRELSQLMAACYHGNPDYVQDLLKVPNVKVDLQSRGGRHPLVCACAYGHTQVAQLLLDACQDPRRLVNLPTTNGRTPLMFASINGHHETVSLLLQKGACINMQDKNGWCSLMLASRVGQKEAVGLLLRDAAVYVNMQDNKGKSSLMMASQCGHKEIVLHCSTIAQKRCCC